MGKMIRFELYKVFQKPLLLLLSLGCLALHLGILWYQETVPGETTPSGVRYTLAELSDMYQTDQTGHKLPEELAAEEAAEPERYRAYREEILHQADLRMHSPLFAGMDAYTDDNLNYTKEAYEKLGEISVCPDFDGGVLLLIQNRLADILCLLLLLVFTLRLLVEERENDTWFLLKAMKRGHGELMAAKLLSLAVLTAGVTVLFYGSAAGFIGLTVGFGDLSRSLQSVEGFMACTLRLSVGEFLPLFLLVKLLGFFCGGSCGRDFLYAFAEYRVHRGGSGGGSGGGAVVLAEYHHQFLDCAAEGAESFGADFYGALFQRVLPYQSGHAGGQPSALRGSSSGALPGRRTASYLLSA